MPNGPVSVVVAAALVLASGCASGPQPDEPSPPGHDPSPPERRNNAGRAPGESAPSSGAGLTGKASAALAAASLEDLAGRIEELEDQRRRLEAQQQALRDPHRERAETLPEPEALIELLVAGDGRSMYRELEALLLAGPSGYRVIYEFLDAAEQKEKIWAFMHDPQLLFAMLRIAARYPDGVSTLSGFLLEATADNPGTFIRREIFNFLPVHLRHHKGKYAEIQELLERNIDAQIASGGEYFYKVSLAMRILDYRPPVELFLPILNDARTADRHPTMIEYLASRGEEGTDTLRRFVREAPDPTMTSITPALIAVARYDDEAGAEHMLEFLEHIDPDLRRAAYHAFFSMERGDSPVAIDLALRYFTSDVPPEHKRVLVRQVLRRQNKAVLTALQERAEELVDEEVRQMVLSEGAAVKAKERP